LCKCFWSHVRHKMRALCVFEKIKRDKESL
jgi:hypothetical protein